MENPKFLKHGEAARLIPVVAETSKERRAVSALLAVMSAVPFFSRDLLSFSGQKISPKTVVDTFTEVELTSGEGAKTNRPDGLIRVSKGSKIWHALIEAKIAKAPLEKEQIERYLRLARDNGVDAVITISNEFAPRPTHHPIQISGNLLKSVKLFHMSWKHVLTEALLLRNSGEVTDTEQKFLLRELIRFLDHDSVGVTGYTNMPQCWDEVVSKFQSGGEFSKSDDNLAEVVSGWHQECRDLSLRMSMDLSRRVSIYIPRKMADDPDARVTADAKTLSEKGLIDAKLRVPDAASDIKIVADLRAKAIRMSMEIEAPGDKKRHSSKANWLLNQLKGVDPVDIIVRLQWASKAADEDFKLSELRDDPKAVDQLQPNSKLWGFEVIMASASKSRFGKRTFIDELEKLCLEFYKRVGQHLKAWQPSPPKIKEDSKEDSKSGKSDDSSEAPTAGNQHEELLDVPRFLAASPPPEGSANPEEPAQSEDGQYNPAKPLSPA
ncbi:MAG: hypothetical protein ACYYKD_08115 [Rhodospirillales bacterium]